MTEQRERPAVDAVEEVEAVVGDEIGDVPAALDDRVRPWLQHHRVVVVPLAGENPPFVEARRVVGGTVAEVPFAEHARSCTRRPAAPSGTSTGVLSNSVSSVVTPFTWL